MIQTEPSALQNIADTASRIVERLDEVMSDKNIAHINQTLANLDNMTAAIGGQKQDIRALVQNLRQTSEQLNTTLATTNQAVGDIDKELPAVLASSIPP